MVGRVSHWNPTKGWGYVVPAGQSDGVFVHYTGIVAVGRKNLQKGQLVQFEFGLYNNKTIAVQVCVLPDDLEEGGTHEQQQ